MNTGPFAAFEKLGVSLTAATRTDLKILDAEILDPREPAHTGGDEPAERECLDCGRRPDLDVEAGGCQCDDGGDA